jgi:large subunit ribosomal protein L23
MDARAVIKHPLVTEKGTLLREGQNKYLFRVAANATKPQIKQAVQELFKVKVTGVATSVVPGKVKRLGRYEGRRPDWKKATVTLAKGQKIELFEGA